MSLFIDPEETFDIVVAYKTDENGSVEVVANDDKADDALIMTFRRPNFDDETAAMSGSATVGSDGRLRVDVATIRANRLKILLKEWKTREGREDQKFVPPTPESVARLHPTVAAAAVEKLHEVIGM